jgi:hypothetical protein
MNRRDFFKSVAALSAAAALPAAALADAAAAIPAAHSMATGRYAGYIRGFAISVMRPAIDVTPWDGVYRKLEPVGEPQCTAMVELLFRDAASLPNAGDIVGKAWFQQQDVISTTDLSKLFWEMPEDLRFWIEELHVEAAHGPWRRARLTMRELPEGWRA